jgi:hypothetical protein
MFSKLFGLKTSTFSGSQKRSSNKFSRISCRLSTSFYFLKIIMIFLLVFYFKYLPKISVLLLLFLSCNKVHCFVQLFQKTAKLLKSLLRNVLILEETKNKMCK